MEMTERPHITPTWGWTGLFGLASLEAFLALLYLTSVTADQENSFFLGFSLRRLLLMGALLALCVCAALLAWYSRKPAWRERWLLKAARGKLLNGLLLLFSAGFLASLLVPTILLSLYRTGGEFSYYAYYERLLPFLVWMALFCLQAFIWLAWVGQLQWQSLRFLRPSFRAALIVYALFGAAWLWVVITRTGLLPDLVGWGDPSVPLLEWQIWFAWVAAICFMLFLLPRRWPARRDWFVAGAIWALASGIWLSQPVKTAFYVTAARAPNYQLYPFSDGAYYGLFAHSLLIGNGFKGGEIPPRPLYITLLAGFHAAGGYEYEQVILLQTLFLAVFPAVLYFIGRELHSRPAGLVMALMAVLRELTAIHTMPITENASTSQLFFADLPSTLAISLWALAVLVWLKSPGRSILKPFLMGATLGIALLFRTQSLLMLVPAVLLGLFALHGRFRLWMRDTVFILAGLFLCAAPWLWRNYQLTGQLTFDDLNSQNAVVAHRYNLVAGAPEPNFSIRPGEDRQAYAGRINQGVIDAVRTRPGEVAQFISAHFVNSEIGNLLLLPVRDGISTPSELLMPAHAFWESWSGSPDNLQKLLMALNLAVIALGIGAAWARLRWAGLALLLINFAYNASNALARNSGWRYLLPADWVSYAYAAAGLMELAVAASLVMGVSPVRLAPHLAFLGSSTPRNPRSAKGKWISLGAAALAFLLIGCLPLIVERAVPQRYPAQEQASLTAEIASFPAQAGTPAGRAELERFLSLPGARIYKGRALYPRFYAADEGEPLTAKTGYEPLDYPRTLFLLASNDYYGLVMLRGAQPPSYLPDASDVILLGCLNARYLDAFLVLPLEQPGEASWTVSELPEACETPPGTIP